MAEEEQKSSPAPCWSNIVKKQPPPVPNRQEVNAAADKVFVESCKSAKGIAVAVVDSTAIIQGGESLSTWADKFVSVSEVMGEIRDPMSRHRLNFIPFTVETKEPSPDALKKVINFARATGDLHTLSDVDLKLIALTYTLESQIHGTKHLRDSPPPIHTVNVRRLPEKDMPGWGSNVPNPEEWEALEQAEDKSNHNSRILPLKDLSLNEIPTDSHNSAADGSTGSGELHAENQENTDGSFGKPKKYFAQKKEVNIEGKKMVANGVDASQGQVDDNASDWLPAVSRSTHRRFLRRKAKRDAAGASSERDSQQGEDDEIEAENPDQTTVEGSDGAKVTNEILENGNIGEGKSNGDDISTILNQMRLEEDSREALEEGEEEKEPCEGFEPNTSSGDGAVCDNNGSIGEEVENTNVGSEDFDTSSQTEGSFQDDHSSEQSWMLRSLSESSVACITSDFAMQNVLLQMGLRLLAPGGMQIRELHRWILRCHACFKVTTDIGRIFCPSCGNGGTLRKVAVTVGENGIVVAARRPRTSLRGTKFSLPLPQGGRNAVTKNPVLREDQLPRKFLYPKTKKKNKEGDELFAPSDLFSHHTDKKAPLQPPVRKALAVFSGKRNPNDNHYTRATAKH